MNAWLASDNTQVVWCHRKSIVSYFPPYCIKPLKRNSRGMLRNTGLPVLIVTDYTLILLPLDIEG